MGLFTTATLMRWQRARWIEGAHRGREFYVRLQAPAARTVRAIGDVVPEAQPVLSYETNLIRPNRVLGRIARIAAGAASIELLPHYALTVACQDFDTHAEMNLDPACLDTP